MDPLLWDAWVSCAGPSGAARDVLDRVWQRYSEPHRHYHDVRHLARVVVTCTGLMSTIPVPDTGAVIAAACFHDAVYDPRSATNEADSAALAEAELAGLGWAPRRCAEVARLVRATAHIAPSAPGAELVVDPDPAADVLLDADLAVLGGDRAAYDDYARGVRAEYAHVDDDGWRTGRAAVLDMLLALPRLYRTPELARWETAARANLERERAGLTGGGGGDAPQ